MKKCKLCGEEMLDLDVWGHITSKHPREVLKYIKVKPIKCHKCKKMFTPKPEIHQSGDITHPIFCSECERELPARRLFGEIVIRSEVPS